MNTGLPRRWLIRLLAFITVGLIPWTLWLAISLPERKVAHHYDLAWVGFDVGLTILFAATAWGAMRRSEYLSPVTAATAALLVCDAWFDVVTASPGDRLEAVLLAVLAELPLAGLCVFVVYELRRR